jgi:ArsR family transcriptional regulator, lead/cadmium/zinc/bismuth-responsive transcriptional repressor
MSNRSYVQLSARLLSEPSVLALAETFKVLGDTTRVRILDALSQMEFCVQDLADLLGLTQSAVSHQLRVLRSMRLVRTRRDGRQIFYALDDDHIVKLFEQGLEHVEERAPTARASSETPRRTPTERRVAANHRAEPKARRGRRWGWGPSAK